MAKLNADNSAEPEQRSLIQLWNASHILTVGLVNRFYRNFTRYREQNWNYANRKQLLSHCYDLEHKIYAYENLQASDAAPSSSDPAIPGLILQQQIFEHFEYLHHQLLYRDPDTIEHIIPLVDRQLELWATNRPFHTLSSHELIVSTQDLSHIELLIQDYLDDR